MQTEDLVYKLKEFHVLETYQVEMYGSQIPSMDEPHLKKAYERMVAREQEHVDFFAGQLKELNAQPSRLFSSAFSAAGFVSGKALDLLSLKERYKLGIAAENKAVAMYYDFIKMSRSDPALAVLNDYLWYYLFDEECHQFWFKEHLSRLVN